MASAHFCLSRYLFVHPLDEFVAVDHHSLADEDGWKAFASHQSVRTGAGDAEDGWQLVCAEGDRQLIERYIGHGLGYIGTPFAGEM